MRAYFSCFARIGHNEVKKTRLVVYVINMTLPLLEVIDALDHLFDGWRRKLIELNAVANEAKGRKRVNAALPAGLGRGLDVDRNKDNVGFLGDRQRIERRLNLLARAAPRGGEFDNDLRWWERAR